MFGLIGLGPQGARTAEGIDDTGTNTAERAVLALNQESVDSIYFNNNLRVNLVAGKHLLGRVYRGNFIAKHHIFICYEQMCSILAQCVDYYHVKSITKFSDLPPGSTDCIKIRTFDSEQIGSYISLNDILSILLAESSAYNLNDTKTAMSLAQQLISTASVFHSHIEVEGQSPAPSPKMSPSTPSSSSNVFISTKQSPLADYSSQYYESPEFARLQANKNEEAYRVMRCLIPVDICVTSLAKLRESELPDSVCDRVFKLKALWLICIHKDDIKKIHIADLLSKYVYHGLDLVEMRAIAHNLPSFDENATDNRKIEWRGRFGEKLDGMIGREMAGTLHDYEIRNLAYKNLSTLRHDFFSPTAPLRRQAHVKSDVSSNSIRNDESGAAINSSDITIRHVRLDEHWTASDDSDDETYSDPRASLDGSEVDVQDDDTIESGVRIEAGAETDNRSVVNISTQKYLSGVHIRTYEDFLRKRKTGKNDGEPPLKSSNASIEEVLDLNEEGCGEEEEVEEDLWNEPFNLSLVSVVESGDVRGLRRLVDTQRVEMTTALASLLLLQVCKAAARAAMPHVELAAYLVDKCGADITYCDENESSNPLHYVASKQTLGKMLISRGANFLTKNKQGQSPLSLCLADEGKECWMLSVFEARPVVISRLSGSNKKELILLLLNEGLGGYVTGFYDEGCFSVDDSSNPIVSSDEALAIMEAFGGDFSRAPQPIETFELLEKLILS